MCLIDATCQQRKVGLRGAGKSAYFFGAEFAVRRLTAGSAVLRCAPEMITLTPRAAQQVRTMQTELNAPAKRLRVLVESGGCSGFQYGMSFDEPKPGDALLESEGVPIVMDPTSLAYLNGCAIDFDDGLQGKGFEIKNPNAQSTCGCGKSFS
jgi:iron-sulfur cluster assembly accessory protein